MCSWFMRGVQNERTAINYSLLFKSSTSLVANALANFAEAGYSKAT